LGARCLEHLVGLEEVEIIGVVCRDIATKGWWHEEGTPRVIDIVEKYGLKKVSEEGLLEYDIDMGISVLFFNIISEVLIRHCSNNIYNLHPAPLPYYRGSNSYSHAIINGEDEYGVTLHCIDKGIDTGPIIKVRWFDIKDNMTSRMLHDKAQKEAFELFKEQIPFLIEGKIKPIQQEEILRTSQKESYTYTKDSLNHLRKIELETIERDPEYVNRIIRGLDFPPFEPAYFTINSKKVYLKSEHSLSWVRRKALKSEDRHTGTRQDSRKTHSRV